MAALRLPRKPIKTQTQTLTRLISTTTQSIPAETLNFESGDTPFTSLRTTHLLKSLLHLHLVTFDPLVDVGIRVMRSGLMDNPLTRKPLLAAIKATVYDHFCAGEDLREANRTLQGLWEDGLRGILDYGLEDAADNDGCDRNLKEFLKTVEATSSLPPSSVSFACVKVTAICPIGLLERVSDLLRWERKEPSFQLPWKLHSLPVLLDSSPLYHTLSKPELLTETEESDLKLAHDRLSKLCETCVGAGLPLLVDAEYTSVQPAIDYLVYTAAMEFNREDEPFVYGTVQAYLRDAKQRMVSATEAAEREGISLGFKLVRGAYISRETALASSLGVASPIHGSIRETHECYDECASFMLERVARGRGSVVLATHNVDSGRVAAARAEEFGIGKGNPRLQFAQLKGMADALSLGLRNAGFMVSKYLPFGPVEQVMPYLLRRAEENRGLLSSSALDRQLIRRELIRRLKQGMSGRE
ncbi:hypothetical protein QJS04_geneDACA024231 [Acorus gramineus]|uniref:Proline dehydrogenase n=1 Tax=Acorus gramineus TaxID=55184 RepID=A0AAV8ZWK1_ACOGR|nr:hypothetical protein QJS04_geneDACA024231 [Acorus gramineus]